MVYVRAMAMIVVDDIYESGNVVRETLYRVLKRHCLYPIDDHIAKIKIDWGEEVAVEEKDVINKL